MHFWQSVRTVWIGAADVREAIAIVRSTLRLGKGAAPPKPGKGPLALRVHLDDGDGFDLTEQGTRKGLAIYVVRDPMDVPGIASLGPDPLTDDFTPERLLGILQEAGRKQLKGVLRQQGTIAGRIARRPRASRPHFEQPPGASSLTLG